MTGLNINAGWTDERVGLLKKLWGEGLSTSQIARQLRDTTRNAVIGKISRLGLSGRPTASAPARVKSVRGGRASPTSMATIVRNAKARKPDQPLPVTKGGAIAAAPRLWTERRFGECAFPVGGDGAETVSCCNATGGPTYCAAHARIMRGAPATDAQRQAARRMREARAKTMRAA